MKILYTAFNGKNNSSKLLLDKINSNNKLYLKNSFITSISQLKKELATNHYDLVISFGQAPLESDTIKIETTGISELKYETKFNYNTLKNNLQEKRYNVLVSNNAGTYLCNNLYYHGLKYINENNMKTKMIFIHIPKIKNINNIELLANIFKHKL